MARVVDPDELEEMGYLVPEEDFDERDALVYIEGYAEPVDEIGEIEADWIEEIKDANELAEEFDEFDDPDDVPLTVRMSGFTPTQEVKRFRDQKAANEVFHRKTESPAPWRLIVGLGMVIGAIFLATQVGII